MKARTSRAFLVAGVCFITAGSAVQVFEGTAPAVPEVCFAPGTSPDVVGREAARRRARFSSLAARGFQFSDSERWNDTATDASPMAQGQVTTLTWNIVADGTPIPGGANGAGEPGAPSNLRSFLNGIYGSEAAWIAHFESVFNQWGALTGVNYVRELNDDGEDLVFSPGILGVRADIRIGGHFIDGDFDILAYNFLPASGGDMVIDTGDAYYATSGLANDSLGFKNMLAHEHGHGLGFRHSCPVNNTKLMEPFLSTAFNHAQLDDKLAGWRGYGDNREDNETSGTASNLGALGNGTTNVTELSIDDNGDVDFYKFAVPPGKRAAVTLTPIGSTYLAGPQNIPSGTCSAGANFNALTVQNLGLELINTNGSSAMASSTGAAAGVAESIPATSLTGGGTFFIRAFATTTVNSVQGYQLSVTISDDILGMSINDVSSPEGDAGTKVVNFTVSLTAPASGPVSANFATANNTATTADGDYAASSGVVSFTAGQQSKQVEITINGDVRNEADETFFVNLSGVAGAVLADAQGIGTITNDDPLPGLSVDDVTVNEGNAGTTLANFTVTLSAVSGQTVTVAAQTSGGTSSSPGDYTAVNTLLTFAPGETTKPVPVTVNGDTDVEPDETFNLFLTGPSKATLLDGIGVGTILSEEKPSRTFVAASGSDTNDCSVQSLPCRNIARALTQTAVDGEVIILTPGSYETAPLTISQGIKITSPSGTVAFIRQPITINAPGGRVVLRGLTLKGTGGGNGITVTAADSVSLEDLTIDRWTNGLRLGNAAASRVSVLNTIVRNTTSGVLDAGASLSNRVVIGQSRFEGNAKGLEILTGTFQVTESTFSGNTTCAIEVAGVADISRSEFTLNGTGLSTLAGGTGRIGRSLVFGNTTGLSAAGGSTLLSFGTNVVRGNGTNTVGTISAVAEQ